MNLIEWREERGISRKEFIGVMQKTFPGYGYPANSMAESPEKYGVCLTAEAEKLAERQWPLEAEKRPVKDRHKQKHKLSFRTSKTFASRFIKALSHSQYKTAQDALYHITLNWIKEQEDKQNV